MVSESELASDIGQAVVKEPAIIDDLANLLNDDNCRKGMLAYIEVFQGGLLKQLAAQIGDNGTYLTEVKRNHLPQRGRQYPAPSLRELSAKLTEGVLKLWIVIPEPTTFDSLMRLSEKQ